MQREGVVEAVDSFLLFLLSSLWSPNKKQSRATRLPPAGNWVRFSCSIPPLFVLSHSTPMINTTGKLASFWRFSITISSISSHSLATVLPLLATRHSPLPPTTLSRWLLPATDRSIAKNRTGPISTSESSISVYHHLDPGSRAK